MKKIIISLLTILIVIVSILVFNTFSLTSRQVEPKSLEKVDIPDAVFQNLSRAIQYRTISFSEDAIPDSTAFHGFHQFLADTFPLVHENLSLEKINEYSLLYKWEG